MGRSKLENDMSEALLVDRAASVVKLTLNRPEKHNALDVPTMCDVAEVIERLAEDRAIRVLVLTGAGGRSFCSGADLSGVGDQWPWDDDPLSRLSNALEHFPGATVCALNGSVYGGGTDVAMACDFRIGQTGQRMFIPPARFGIHYQISGLRRAVGRIGLGPAKRLYLAGETFDASEMKRVGFLDHLVEPAEFDAFVAGYVAEIAGMAPLAVRGMKSVLNAVARGDLDEEKALLGVHACIDSEDFKEGQRAIAERRKPVFQGR
ncbi:3-hydroxybutyryl-CoA dehydratase [Minwuia thermotolerans]|uniref:3-hydroxybutyryl-CoA dehydratase n=2 Tax=Minwuia thermotolerans TaxID=2056226 RepID=A0A2M9FZN5_9PROT|nr:3-hydroxybutyryl-CoA dehydratase [Minwuia thermotolerans]